MDVDVDRITDMIRGTVARSMTYVLVDADDRPKIHAGPGGRIPTSVLIEAATTFCRHCDLDPMSTPVFRRVVAHLERDWCAGRNTSAIFALGMVSTFAGLGLFGEVDESDAPNPTEIEVCRRLGIWTDWEEAPLPAARQQPSIGAPDLVAIQGAYHLAAQKAWNNGGFSMPTSW